MASAAGWATPAERPSAARSVGSLTDWAVSQTAASRSWGLSDIRGVGVGDTPARVAALRTRAVDAAVIDIAAALDLEDRGMAKILLNFGDLITTFQNQIIFASDAAIADKPVAVRAFVEGWFETVAYARSHKPETVAFAEEALGVRASVAARVYDQLMGSGFFSSNGAIDPAILAVMSRSFVELKLLPTEQPLAIRHGSVSAEKVGWVEAEGRNPSFFDQAMDGRWVSLRSTHPCISRSLYNLDVPQGTARPGWPPGPGRRSSDRNPSKRRWLFFVARSRSALHRVPNG